MVCIWNGRCALRVLRHLACFPLVISSTDICSNLHTKLFRGQAREWWRRGTLGVAEHRITAKKFDKYRNTAKNIGKYRNFIVSLYSWWIRWREGKNRCKNERWDCGNNGTTLNGFLKQSNCRLKCVTKQGCFRLLQKRLKILVKSEGYVFVPKIVDQNVKKRIPQVSRIPQYRNSRLKLPKYRMKNWPIPQYRKAQCPPREGKERDTLSYPGFMLHPRLPNLQQLFLKRNHRISTSRNTSSLSSPDIVLYLIPHFFV